MIRCGILIIGSLLWDNQGREKWRQSRLNVDQKVSVRVPIHYWRLSKGENRGSTYTMTFGGDAPEGQAWLVPYKKAIDGVGTVVAEAKALWNAEDHNASPGQIGKQWGCVGVLFQPGVALGDLRSGWAAHFSKKVSSPIPPVDKKGVLGIPWPTLTLDGSPADIDVILATANKAEAPPPSAEDIADAWVDQNDGDKRYFFENVRHGIRTPEDGLIWRQIEQRTPHRLGDKTYAQAIAILRRSGPWLG